MKEQLSQPVYQQQSGNMVENSEKPKQGLAITSFVLAILGFNILGLIFGIIALKKKQLRWAALTGTIISAVRLFFAIIILTTAIIPRLGVAQQRARDIARKDDLLSIGTAIVSYSTDNNKLPESTNGCAKDIVDTLVLNGYLTSSVDDPLYEPFQSGLFCNSDKLGYGYWTNGTSFAVSASVEYPISANLCKTNNKDYVSEFKNALSQNDLQVANSVLDNIGDSCTETGASNLYYVIMY